MRARPGLPGRLSVRSRPGPPNQFNNSWTIAICGPASDPQPTCDSPSKGGVVTSTYLALSTFNWQRDMLRYRPGAQSPRQRGHRPSTHLHLALRSTARFAKRRSQNLGHSCSVPSDRVPRCSPSLLGWSNRSPSLGGSLLVFHTRQVSARQSLIRSLICLRFRLCSSACLANSTTSSSAAKRRPMSWSSLRR